MDYHFLNKQLMYLLDPKEDHTLSTRFLEIILEEVFEDGLIEDSYSNDPKLFSEINRKNVPLDYYHVELSQLETEEPHISIERDGKIKYEIVLNNNYLDETPDDLPLLTWYENDDGCIFIYIILAEKYTAQLDSYMHDLRIQMENNTLEGGCFVLLWGNHTMDLIDHKPSICNAIKRFLQEESIGNTKPIHAKGQYELKKFRFNINRMEYGKIKIQDDIIRGINQFIDEMEFAEQQQFISMLTSIYDAMLPPINSRNDQEWQIQRRIILGEHIRLFIANDPYHAKNSVQLQISPYTRLYYDEENFGDIPIENRTIKKIDQTHPPTINVLLNDGENGLIGIPYTDLLAFE